MLKSTITSVLARKLRLVTTSLAVLLGVAFMAGTLVLTDTIGATFDDLFAEVNDGVDAHVRAESDVRDGFGEAQRARVDGSLVDAIAAVDEVASAEGFILGYARIIDKDGEPLGDPGIGAPTYGGNWPTTDALNPFHLSDGRPPGDASEVVIDRASALEAGFEVGDRVRIVTQSGTHTLDLVGITRFGQIDSAGGASMALFTVDAAQALIAEPARFDSIEVVAAAGVDEEEVRTAVAAVVPPGIEVLTGTEITAEDQNEMREALSFLNIFLFTFAAIALFVGSFIIYNTFSILVAQRSREMALLRAIGASRHQVLGSVLLEAVIIGLVASILGLVAGVAVAAGLQALLAAFAFDIPTSGLIVSGRTIVIAFIVGVTVTAASALFPARRAARIPPIAAMRDVALDRSARSTRRIAIGTAVTALGVALLAVGLIGGGDRGPGATAMGAAVVFLGVAALGPVIAGPVSRVIGSPLPRLRGMPGLLARQNAMRNPKRTASTAAALMIGVGLVGFITIVASSARASIDETVERAFLGDLVIDSGTFGFGGLPPEMAARIAQVPAADAVSPVRVTGVRVDDSDQVVIAIDATEMARILDFGVVAGSPEALGDRQVAVLDRVAQDNGWAVGDSIPVRFAATGDQELEVAMLYTAGEIGGSFMVDLTAFEANVADRLDTQVFVNLTDGADAASARADVAAVVDDFPSATLLDRTEFKDQQSATINQILNLIYVMLALAVVIALIGIANTLALSIFERTKELGLLRAVGMTRGQLRSTIRWEAVIVALLGTTLGLLIGLFFGWALVTALRDEGLTTFAAAPGQLAVIAALAALAGVCAAILPARRASRLDVLDAIAST